MNKLLAATFCVISLSPSLAAQDITALEKIGPVTGFVRSDKGVILNCQDRSQVQLTVLAPDLIRVRASFTKPIPAKDHSWAIAKDNWETPRWNLKETPESITIATDEVEVVVRRSPLLIEFRDARTHDLNQCRRTADGVRREGNDGRKDVRSAGGNVRRRRKEAWLR